MQTDPSIKLSCSEQLLRDLIQAQTALQRSRAKDKTACIALDRLIVQVTVARSKIPQIPLGLGAPDGDAAG